MKTILVHGLGQTLADWNKTIDCMKVDMDYVCPNLSDMLKDKKVGYPRRVNSLILIATQYVMPKKLLAFQNVIFRFMPQKMFRQMGFGKKEFIELSKSMMTLDFSKDLEKIICPVLVICGEKDNANMKASKKLEHHLLNAEFRVIENSGHEVNVERPKRLAEIISEFL